MGVITSYSTISIELRLSISVLALYVKSQRIIFQKVLFLVLFRVVLRIFPQFLTIQLTQKVYSVTYQTKQNPQYSIPF